MATLAVIWCSAGLTLALDADTVAEVLPPPAWRCTPGAPIGVRGLFDYRGRLIPLVDVAVLLGAETAPDRVMNRVIVANVNPARAGPSWPVGLWIERLLDVERIDFGAHGHHPGFATEAGRFLGPVASTRWGPVQLVRPDQLFTPEQIAALTERIAEVPA